MDPIELTAAIFGFICVYLTTRQSIYCWPAGLIQVSLYIIVFYEAKLYSDVILHIIYVILQVYGWYYWLHGNNHHQAVVTRLSVPMLVNWIIIGIIAAGIWGTVMHTYTDAALPYPDAFIIAMSLIGQWLMAKKKIENWYFWIAVDVVAIVVYSVKELYVTSGLYFTFLIICLYGMRKWRLALDGIKDALPSTEFSQK